jgi:broad specificity phosphatase PhoE
VLFLVRHGESAANAGRLLVGRTDSPLTPLGMRQAAATGGMLADLASAAGTGVARILASPLARAHDSARIIAGTLAASLGDAPDVEVDERAIELDYGDLEGIPVSDVAPETWRAWRAEPAWRPPGGESLDDVSARFVPLLEALAPAAAGDDVVVVSHVSPIKAGVAWALGVGVEASWRLTLGVSAVTRVGFPAGRPCLVSYGETVHLAGL